VICATPLEARIRELRLIAEHKPRFNRRSTHPERMPWLKLTAETFPRLSIVREVKDDGASYIGPFGSASAATEAMEALYETFPVRQCTLRLGPRPAPNASACLQAELGRCGAPCTGAIDIAGYASMVDRVRAAMTCDARAVVRAGLERAQTLAAVERFEEAAIHRDRMLAFLTAAARAQRLGPLAGSSELVAGKRTEAGGWELVLIRHGRLAGTTVSLPGADPNPYIDALRSTGEVVSPRPRPMPAAHPAETEQVLSWLEQVGVRLIHLDGEWSSPAYGAHGARSRLGSDVPAVQAWSSPWGHVADWAARHAAACPREASPPREVLSRPISSATL
jgi:DNA polymerase-3 subunit epsilon